MGARGQEILATVKQRIEALENELAVHLETRNQVGAQQLRQQIQELQTKYSEYVIQIHIYGKIPEDFRDDDYRAPLVACENLPRLTTDAPLSVNHVADVSHTHQLQENVPSSSTPAQVSATFTDSDTPKSDVPVAKRVRRRAKRTNSRSMLSSAARKIQISDAASDTAAKANPTTNQETLLQDSQDHAIPQPSDALLVDHLMEDTPAISEADEQQAGTVSIEPSFNEGAECKAIDGEAGHLKTANEPMLTEEKEENSEAGQHWSAKQEQGQERELEGERESDRPEPELQESEEHMYANHDEQIAESVQSSQEGREIPTPQDREEEEIQSRASEDEQVNAFQVAEESDNADIAIPRSITEVTSRLEKQLEAEAQPETQAGPNIKKLESSERRAAKKRKQQPQAHIACLEAISMEDQSHVTSSAVADVICQPTVQAPEAQHTTTVNSHDDFGSFLRRAETKLEEVLRDKENLERGLEGAREQINFLATNLAAREREVNLWQAHIDQLREELRSANNTHRQILAQGRQPIQQANGTGDAELIDRIERLQGEKKTYETECHRLRTELRIWQEKSDEQLLKISHLEIEVQEQKKLLSLAQQHTNEELEALQIQFEDVLQESEAKIKGLEKERLDLLHKLSGLEEELVRLKQRVMHEGTDRDKLRETQLGTLQSEVDSLRAQNTDLTRKVEQLQADSEALHTRISEEKSEKEKEWNEFIVQMEDAIKNREIADKELEKSKNEIIRLGTLLENAHVAAASVSPGRDNELLQLREEKTGLQARLAREIEASASLSHENKELKEEVSGKLEEILKLKAVLAKEELRLAEMNDQLRGVEAELMRTVAEKDESVHRLQTVEYDLVQVKAENGALTSTAAQVKAENEILREQLRDSRREVEEANSQLNDLRLNLSTIKEKQQAQEGNPSINEELEQLRLLVNEKEQDLADRQISLESLQRRCEGLQSKLEEAVGTAEELMAKVSCQEERIAFLEDAEQKKEEERKALLSSIEDLSKEVLRIEHLEKARTDLLEERDGLAQKTASMKEKFAKRRQEWDVQRDELQKQIDNLSADLVPFKECQKKNMKMKRKVEQFAETENRLLTDKRQAEERIRVLEKQLEEEKTLRQKAEARLVEKEEAPAEEDQVKVATTSPKKRKEVRRKREVADEDSKEQKTPSQETDKNDTKVTARKRRKADEVEDNQQEQTGTVHETPARIPESARSPARVKPQSKLSLRSSKAKAKVVYFSGFSETNKDYSVEYKNELAKMVTDLGGEVRFDNEFNELITHVVRPVGSRTMKTLAAALTQRWLVSPEWILESVKNQEFVPEDNFGARMEERPFHNKSFCFDTSFIRENQSKTYKYTNAKTLIQLGSGVIVEVTADHIDYTLVGAKHDPAKIRGQPLTWTQFIALIPGSKEDALDSTVSNVSVIHGGATSPKPTTGRSKRKRGAAPTRPAESHQQDAEEAEKENHDGDEDEGAQKNTKGVSGKRKRVNKKQQNADPEAEPAAEPDAESKAAVTSLSTDKKSSSQPNSQSNEDEEPSGTPRRLARRKARRTTKGS